LIFSLKITLSLGLITIITSYSRIKCHKGIDLKNACPFMSTELMIRMKLSSANNQGLFYSECVIVMCLWHLC